jgi:hypothetical protein
VSAVKFIIPKRIFLLSIVLLSNAVYANDAVHIGSATTIVNDVFTSTSGGETRIKINDPLFFKQQIITKENSTLTATFRDSSTFSIAPQSVVILDEFIFNPSENVLEKSINIIKGSFRYISGFPSKNSVTKIITPFGTAGIRGSAVQGTVTPKGGFSVNVGSGVVDFEAKDGKKVTVQEGETLSLSAMCDTLPTPPESVATSMQYLADIFANTASPLLTAEQLLANATANNIPASLQKQAYATVQETPVNPQDLQGQGVDLGLKSTKVVGDTQVIIEKLIQDLQNKNNIQIDSATRDITAMLVASSVSDDKIIQIGINAVIGAKNEHKVYVAMTVINTLVTLKPALINELAPKLQQALPAEQQPALPLLLPNVVFPPLPHS